MKQIEIESFDLKNLHCYELSETNGGFITWTPIDVGAVFKFGNAFADGFALGWREAKSMWDATYRQL